jgi:transposase-like protein
MVTEDGRDGGTGPGSPERSKGARSAPARSAGEPGQRTRSPESNEVDPRPKRRIYTAEYKLRILREVEACTVSGAVGEILRREGLYASHLRTWRRQRDAMGGIADHKRGPVAKTPDPAAKECERLRRENSRLKAELDQARAIIDLQKKVAALLGPANTPENDGDAP